MTFSWYMFAYNCNNSAIIYLEPEYMLDITAVLRVAHVLCSVHGSSPVRQTYSTNRTSDWQSNTFTAKLERHLKERV
jgi:hypothetical protein